MMTLRFSGLWPWWLILIAAIVGSIWIGRWYWRESQHIRRPFRWLLPVLRSSAFFLLILMLAGPTLYHRRVEGELSRIRVVMDLSDSMATSDHSISLANAPEPSMASIQDGPDRRIDQVVRWLLGGSSKPDKPEGWLLRQRDNHRIEWFGARMDSLDPRSLSLIWDSQSNAAMPARDSIRADGQASALGEALRESLENSPAAVVFVTDGQSNSGQSLLSAAASASDKRIPVFTIGVGIRSEPDDFGILQVDHSQRVFRTDLIRGTITIKERTPTGTPYRIEIEQFGTTIWTKELESQNQEIRRIEFEIPAEALLEAAKQRLPSGIDNSMVPIDLTYLLKSKAVEVSQANNSFGTSLWGVERRNRVLLMDRRGGWETRYIKNALSRDAAWDTELSLGRPAFERDYFPSTRSKLFDYDLVLLSLSSLPKLSAEQKNWLSDFVSVSGGGLILIDSKRTDQSTAMDDTLPAWMPVKPLAVQDGVLLKSLRLAQAAMEQPAMQLGTTTEPNQKIWQELPTPKSIRHIELEPGAEVLLEGVAENNDSKAYPLIATKLFGQGRVVYMAFDETWRWRYNVADLIHQRFWNQLASWTMRAPFATNDTFASLDSGLRMVSTDEQVTVRAKLKKDDSQPLEDAVVQAILSRNGERFAAIPLVQDRDARGFYSATIGPLAKGQYRVQLEAVGVPNDALVVQTEFVVQPPAQLEMQTLACNVEVLTQTAESTGGAFAMLEDAESISELLKRYRTGKTIESQNMLWQSYPWFATIMTLLALEWYLRKRVGLI
jgi:hypothetical protein